MVTCQKWCKKHTFLLHTTNRLYHGPPVPIRAISNNLEWPWRSFAGCKSFQMQSDEHFRWHFARFQLTRRVARSLGDSWASCCFYLVKLPFVFLFFVCFWLNWLRVDFWAHVNHIVSYRMGLFFAAWRYSIQSSLRFNGCVIYAHPPAAYNHRGCGYSLASVRRVKIRKERPVCGSCY